MKKILLIFLITAFSQIMSLNVFAGSDGSNNLTKKEEIVGTLGFFGFTGNLIKIFGFMFIGFEFYEYLTLILLMIPSTILGSRVGQILLFKIDEKTFKVIFDAILFLLALRLLF